MKNTSLLLFACLLLFGCSKSDNPNEELICTETLTCNDEDCLFTINNAVGETMFLTCFDRWGIYAPSTGIDDSDLWLIVDDWDSNYNVADLSITFCGYVRENEVPLQFPDPNIGPVYQIKLVDVEQNQ